VASTSYEADPPLAARPGVTAIRVNPGTAEAGVT
jgi:hypothetical protein